MDKKSNPPNITISQPIRIERRRTPDRMCTSPCVYTTTQMAESMATTRERTLSENNPAAPINGSSDGDSSNGLASTRPGVYININGANNSPKTFLIGVAGGTASGKSTVCRKIIDMLEKDNAENRHRVDIISQECFYKTLSEKEQQLAAKGQFDFDHPSAFDEKLMVRTICDLKAGRSVTLPEYDYVNHCGNWKNTQVIQPADVILFEGILTFYFKDVREEFNMKLFVDTDADTRLSRRVTRDMNERGRPLETILAQYINFVKPAFEEFCLPTKKYADVIIPRGADNNVAIDLIVQHIQDLLKSSQNGAQLGTNTISVATSPDPSVSSQLRPH